MSLFSRLNPTPAFPEYTGPYRVGTIDVEIPAADIPSPSPLPDSAPSTIAFRVFYPCEQTPTTRPVRWIPSPQRPTITAFAKFLGAGSTFASIFSLFPALLYYITIPALRNAPLLDPPTPNQRWPVMFFSHGLAGSRNMYSHICGSLSSHGLVVIAMDHRDGSSPIQYIRATKTTESRTVDALHLPHTPTQDVYDGRDKQLRMRLWELAMAHTALLKVDQGEHVDNLDENTSHDRKKREEVLDQFAGKLDVHEPGKIAFGGHSFGACTTIQLLKTVFYGTNKPEAAANSLIQLKPDSDLAKQITSSTPIALLDLWCLPLRSPSQKWLWENPLPAYAPGGPGGRAIVSILSQGFFNWAGNCNDAKRAITPPANYDGENREPHCYYPASSQHFSQSDFGILFPYITRRLMKAEEPERLLRLNARAVLQTFRESGLVIADTTAADREVDGTDDGADKIFANDGSIRGWIQVDVAGNLPNGDIGIEQEGKQAPADELMDGTKMEM
ncbi:hypothetical protein AAFC00_002639 [Neodothiora populina]|uniref:Putative phospholipase n=1 Tax=Neodothiora populina TaxID=2781224 RepID=A0ABR3P938_9PEZI